MIVKNEESVILRSIDCWSKFAEEIVIVDTGSTDSTEVLAKSRPRVKFFHSELFNKDTAIDDFSFSKAKNEAIKKCTGDWVMWVDADDLMPENDIVQLSRLPFNVNHAYVFTIVSGNAEFEHTRLFPNGSGIFFNEEYSCHEFLSLKGLQAERHRNIKIQHLPEVKKERSDRNVRILMSDYNKGKRDSRTLFYLGNGYREMNQLDKAMEMYEEYLKVSVWKEERFFARLFMAQIYVRKGKLVEAKSACFQALAEDHRFAEVYCLLGDLFAFQKDWSKAENFFSLAMSCSIPQDSKLFVTPFLYSVYPKTRIADCQRKDGINSFERGR